MDSGKGPPDPIDIRDWYIETQCEEYRKLMGSEPSERNKNEFEADWYWINREEINQMFIDKYC